MWRNIVSTVLTFSIVILLALAGAIAWGKAQFNGPGPLAEAVCYEVQPGASFSAVGKELAGRGIVSSYPIFRAGVDYLGKGGELKRGSYLIDPGTSMRGIVDALTAGGASSCGTELVWRIGVRANDVVLRALDPATRSLVEVARYRPGAEPEPAEIAGARADRGAVRRITMAEGVTSWQAVEGLKGSGQLAGEAPEVPAEGTLAPGTYDIAEDTTIAEILRQMRERQAAALAEAWAARAPGVPYRTPEEALVMASIVEKETGIAEERARVAAVFVNRLAKGMKLQTDPTVIYGVTKGQGVLERGLRQSELRRETPYNTYVIEGLPPTPIANPGTEAIRAALNPAQTQDLFFVADGTGGHVFAATLEEHNRNVARWRAIERQQGQGGAQ